MMFPWQKKSSLLLEQGKDYIEYWADRYTEVSANQHLYWIEHLIPFLIHNRQVDDACNANEEDISEFIKYVSRFSKTFYSEMEARKVTVNFISYTKRAKMEKMKSVTQDEPVRKGPLPNIELDNRIRDLRENKELSFREIARVVNRDVKTVYDRFKRATAGEGQG